MNKKIYQITVYDSTKIEFAKTELLMKIVCDGTYYHNYIDLQTIDFTVDYNEKAKYYTVFATVNYDKLMVNYEKEEN